MKIRLGTRGSVLARWQADWCADALRKKGHHVEIIVIETSGDRIQDESIINIGAQGVFTKEIQRTLLREEIDVAVHSLKDLPTEPVDGLLLAAVPKRGQYRDAFLCRDAVTINELPSGSKIGTGSLRRKTQLIYQFGTKFQFEEIRGNVETRLRKMERGEYDAIILAEAGLDRLGFSERICSFLEPPAFFPAAGQGAIGLECRICNTKMIECLTSISDPAAFAAVRAERAMLQKLQGGCIAPIAALGTAERDTLTLSGRILSLDGKTQFDAARSAPINYSNNNYDNDVPESLGFALADELVQLGADSILHEIRKLRM
jgi:hydroxymethylbilane synthase